MDKAVIEKVQGFGFDVYMRKPEDSWLIFTDGKRIGYLQTDRSSGFTLSTVHKPNGRTGTGFQMGRDVVGFDKPDLELCFLLAPSWATHDERESVNKYRDMDAFLNADDWNRGYRKVPV